MTGRVLVAYGSKFGSTAEIAQAIGATLRGAGLEVDLQRARDVRSLEPYRAVVLGSAVYASPVRWRQDAMRLLRRRSSRSARCGCAQAARWARTWANRPSSLNAGPSQSASSSWAAQIGAHEHVVFGGRVSEDAGAIFRKKMASSTPPEFRDRRDWGAIEAWAQKLADSLRNQPAPPRS